MTSRARDKFRKYKSGNEKKKIKQNKEKYLKLQQGSFERFLKDDKDNKVTMIFYTILLIYSVHLNIVIFI